jgi:YidC/Oxa1 family membrane protein insertase
MNIFGTLWTAIFIQPLANGLIFFYRLLGGNLGLAIIVFSIVLRLILTPLTRPYMNSMKKMKDHQGELNKLKEKHKGDKAKQMQAQADFYREKGINPGAGCLPYLLQIVILLAFFRLFMNVLGAENIVEQFNTLLYEPLHFAADATINTRFLYLDLTKPDVFNVAGLPFPLPGPLLILSAAIQFLSAKITQPYIQAERKAAEKTPQKDDDFATAMQSSMIYTFPLITLVAGVSFPSGLAIYWLMFSLFQMYQQYRSSGWGGLTPWLVKAGLIQLPSEHGRKHKQRGSNRNSKDAD